MVKPILSEEYFKNRVSNYHSRYNLVFTSKMNQMCLKEIHNKIFIDITYMYLISTQYKGLIENDF